VNNIIRHIVASMISLVILILLKDWNWIPENDTKPITNWIWYSNMVIDFVNSLISLSIPLYFWMGITKRIKKLHEFLFKSFFPPFIATFCIAIFILLMQFLWKYIDDLVGKGLEINIILQLILYAAARFVPLALPIAILIASIMTFGNLGEKNELAALKSSGISLRRTLTPLLFLAIIISYSSFLYSNHIMPVANLKAGTLLWDISKKKPAINIREGEFYNEIDNYSIKVEKKESGTNKLYGIKIYDHTSNQKNDKVIIAESGDMRFVNNGKILELILYNGSSYLEVFDKNRNQKLAHQRINFEKNIIRFDLKKFGLKRSDESQWGNHYPMMSVRQLNKAIDELEIKQDSSKNKFSKNYTNKFNLNSENNNSTKIEKSNRSETEIYDFVINKVRAMKALLKSNSGNLIHQQKIINRHKIEWHRKYSLAFACIILFIIGASIGSIIRKGGFGIPVLISIILFVLYHVLNMIGEKAVKESTLLPFEGMWLSNLVFFPISIFLLYKASKDSSLLDFSYYTQTINNFIFKRKLNKS
jgi:lipopolysaccharide export system permease protein